MRIAVRVFDGITTFHLAAPLLVFGELSRRYPDSGWTTTVWSDDGSPVRTEEGVTMGDLHGPSVSEHADLLVFPSWPVHLPEPEPGLRDLIRAAHARGAGIAGLCLGSFPVVGSGILDGRTAATHWSAAEELAVRHPAVQVSPNALYLDHGDVLTSAGTASALDACLHIVRARLGSEVAATVARHLVIAPHREGDQAQYIDRPVLDDPEEGAIGETMAWALENLDRSLTVEALAGRASMSPRNFSRRFRETTGMSPARWILSRRLDEARRLLETTDRPIAQIAAACGFASAVTFRQNFTARYATTPTSYRNRFTDHAEVPVEHSA
ncbi:GlxA family transcriptional regulator [Nocardiopsis sp. JB363]|uniref:GlxA family transcriptional regulator n=1 Tax=Nocardiopsis sp. JB363 TaxID=1434837 RepID=UPI000979DDFF|nr:helix-turn-helix domain-containing protein [Nocardiopsis sp. JB363]SIO89806.1 Transcriptional regulator, AraC family [Nocardiopsis sp. JB363]